MQKCQIVSILMNDFRLFEKGTYIEKIKAEYLVFAKKTLFKLIIK